MDCVHWPRSAVDERGQPVFGDAVSLRCRWENKAEEFIDAGGTRRVSNAVVYVGVDLSPGDKLYLGRMSDLDSDLSVPAEAMEILGFEKIPTLKATKFLRRCYL